MSNPKNLERLALYIEPLDSLFFRGGRPMESGSRNRSELPGPQNLLGMIRTYIWGACGCDFSQLAHQLKQGATPAVAAASCGVPEWAAKLQVRGPWLARFSCRQTEAEDLFLAPPANLEPGNGKHWVLHPSKEPMPGISTSSAALMPLWNRSWARERVNPPEDAAGKKTDQVLIRFKALREFLSGATALSSGLDQENFISPRKLYALEPKVGIGLSVETLTVEEGLLFSTDLLRLNLEYCQGFYAEILADSATEVDRLFASPVVLTFGGESRCVSVRAVQPLVWPTIEGNSSRFAYLLSPAFFGAKAVPDRLPGNVAPCAVSVRDAYSISGWDLARHGPKPVRFGVAAGSVYFTESSQPCDPLTSVTTECEDQAAGYGAVLQGVWNYA